MDVHRATLAYPGAQLLDSGSEGCLIHHQQLKGVSGCSGLFVHIGDSLILAVMHVPGSLQDGKAYLQGTQLNNELSGGAIFPGRLPPEIFLRHIAQAEVSPVSRQENIRGELANRLKIQPYASGA